MIVFHSGEPERYNFALKGKMSSVFYQMYLEKLSKLSEEAIKKQGEAEKKMKREGNDTATDTYRTIYHEKRSDARSEG